MVPELGGQVFYLDGDSVGKDELNIRWGERGYIGIRKESGEIIVGTSRGIIKARTYKPTPEMSSGITWIST